MSEVIDLIPNVSLSPLPLLPPFFPLSKLDVLHRKAMEEPSWPLLSKRSQCEKAPSYMTLMTQHSERLTLQGQLRRPMVREGWEEYKIKGAAEGISEAVTILLAVITVKHDNIHL